MTHDNSALLTQLDALTAADSGAVFAELIRAGLPALIEAEATETIGAHRYERSAERSNHRTAHRNEDGVDDLGRCRGHDPQSWVPGHSSRACSNDADASTRPCRRWCCRPTSTAVSTRSVDDLVTALGVSTGISTSEVSRSCAESRQRRGRVADAFVRRAVLCASDVAAVRIIAARSISSRQGFPASYHLSRQPKIGQPNRATTRQIKP